MHHRARKVLGLGHFDPPLALPTRKIAIGSHEGVGTPCGAPSGTDELPVIERKLDHRQGSKQDSSSPLEPLWAPSHGMVTQQ